MYIYTHRHIYIELLYTNTHTRPLSMALACSASLSLRLALEYTFCACLYISLSLSFYVCYSNPVPRRWVRPWPLQDSVLLLVVCARINCPFILPARLHCPLLQYYCTAIGQIYEPPPDPLVYAIYHTILAME